MAERADQGWLARLAWGAVGGALGWALWALGPSLWWAAQLGRGWLAIGAGGVLVLIPGLALLRLWPGALPLDQRVALAASLGLGMVPLAVLAGSLVALPLGPPLLVVGLLVLAAIAFWPPTQRAAPDREARQALVLLAGSSLLGLLIASFAARDLLVGQFGDSYHHTVITQLFLDHDGLFRSWQPYAPLITFTYHFGFHSMAAAFAGLSGQTAADGVLGLGHLLGALSAPAIYALSFALSGQRRYALWAALVVVVLSPMPAYYANWGRYTQFAGQTLLPAVAVIWFRLIELALSEQPARRDLVRIGLLAALSTAAIGLTHYRVAVFAALLVAVFALFALITRWRAAGWVGFWRLGLTGLGGALGAGVLMLPWLLRLREGLLLQLGVYLVSNNVGNEVNNSYSLEQVAAALPPLLLIPSLIGLIIALWQRSPIALIAAWAALLWLAANPFLLGLNGAGLLSSFAVILAAYLIAAPLAGTALGWLSSRLGRAAWALAAGLALIGWLAPGQLRVIDPQFQLYRPADAAAAAWLAERLGPGERVFVNPIPAFGATLYAGSDGGWWLPFQIGAATNLPPFLYSSEAADPPDFYYRTTNENAALLALPAGSPEALAALRAAGFRYLYDGPAANPPAEYLNPTLLDAAEGLELVYREAGASIWQIK